MEEAAKELRRAYKRDWAKKNPDKVRAQQERYWARKAQQMGETRSATPEAQGADKERKGA